MEKKTKEVNDKKRLIIAVVIIIIAIVVLYFLISSFGKNSENKTNTNNNLSNNSNAEIDDGFKMIRVDQTLDKDGKVANLDGVKWHNARIMQNDDKMEISIDLNSETEKEIEAKTLEVKVLDKNGKTVFTKELQMEKITKEKRYTIIEMEFDIEEYFVVYDIQISAK